MPVSIFLSPPVSSNPRSQPARPLSLPVLSNPRSHPLFVSSNPRRVQLSLSLFHINTRCIPCMHALVMATLRTAMATMVTTAKRKKITDKIFFLSTWFLLLMAAMGADFRMDEAQVLLEVKKSFSDKNHKLQGWNIAMNSDHCSWTGLACDNITFAVISMNLSGLNLGGEISPSIGKLKNLKSIDISSNLISGPIPDEISGCTELQTLDLSFNFISGDIPFSISKLKQLEQLILKRNQISGPVPSMLSQMPNLKALDLAQNRFTGEIPTLLYWTEVLQYLGLRENFLSGNLSPDMCRLTGLWYFDVRGNNLTGPIPESIGNCTSFQILDLAFNQLSGEIPSSIGFLQIATLSLQGNKLSGTIPVVIGLMQALAVLDLSYNQLTGSIPSILGNLSYTGKLYLHGNSLTGEIPPELGNMSNLSYLQLHGNGLDGRIPSELGNLQKLFELNLSNNNLEGPIPEDISSCFSMNYFNVHGNNLSGTIPSTFQKLGSLTYLNLSWNNILGSIPEELGHIRNLDTLDLSKNGLTGSIPDSIGNLEHLLTLDLGANELSGRIPSALGNLRSIFKMDLSSNHLSGSIPHKLGQLQNLNILYLNNNSLSGEIPAELANCFSLAFLNLSYNNLSGGIPATKNFSRFPDQSFVGNDKLCGEWVGSNCHFKTEMSTRSKKRIVIGSVCTLCLLLLLAIGCFLWRLNHPNEFLKGSSKCLQDTPRMVALHMDLALHSYDDIMGLTENLSENFVIGYGASSIVYKCVLKTGKLIAIKKLYNQHRQNRHEFETEVTTIGKVKHRNLVSLLGYAISGHENLLFYDLMENGSLWDILHGKDKNPKLDWDTRLRIALGAAQGLEYLHHDCDPRIIHRDVKASNILLDENFEAHLSDFGIAKCISSARSHTSTCVMGTIGYIDPEYARTSRLNEKTDIYSFGVVLLELLTGRKAVDDDINLHQWVLSKYEMGNILDTVDPVVTSTCTDLALVQKAFQLALLCTKRQASARPTMHDIISVLICLGQVGGAPVAKQDSSGGLGFNYNHSHSDNEQRENSGARMSSSGNHLFVRFNEVVSQNSV